MRFRTLDVIRRCNLCLHLGLALLSPVLLDLAAAALHNLPTLVVGVRTGRAGEQRHVRVRAIKVNAWKAAVPVGIRVERAGEQCVHRTWLYVEMLGRQV